MNTINTDESKNFTFSDVVQLIRKATDLGYAEAAHILDEAIEPYCKERERKAQRDEAAFWAGDLSRLANDAPGISPVAVSIEKIAIDAKRRVNALDARIEEPEKDNE